MDLATFLCGSLMGRSQAPIGERNEDGSFYRLKPSGRSSHGRNRLRLIPARNRLGALRLPWQRLPG